jgi:hypothetical protein
MLEVPVVGSGQCQWSEGNFRASLSKRSLVSNPNVGGRFAAVRNRGFSRVWLAGWERFEIGSYDRGPIGADARSVSMVLSFFGCRISDIGPSPWTARPDDPV